MRGRADRAKLAITPRPIRTAKARVSQAHERAEHDQVQSKEPGQEDEFSIALFNLDHWLRSFRRQPIREFFNNLIMSSRTSTGSALGGNSIIRLPKGSMIHMRLCNASVASAPV